MSESVARIEFHEVTRSFEDGARSSVLALKSTSFALDRGRCLRVLGPSGAGKSTLLSIACGVLTPSSGEVRLDGEPFSRWREPFRAAARRSRMAVVVQQLALVRAMTVLENVTLGRVPDGLLSTRARREALSVLARLGIETLAHAKVDQLSGGERQRVALARALASETTELFVLDEPTAHLDRARVEVLVAMLRERLSAGASALVATHDPRLDALGDALELEPAAPEWVRS